MTDTSMILSGILLLAMLLFFAPRILAANRGRILQNVALWLAIILGLAMVYKNFGPDSETPLFKKPDSIKALEDERANKANDGKGESEPSDEATPKTKELSL